MNPVNLRNQRPSLFDIETKYINTCQFAINFDMFSIIWRVEY